MDEKKKIDFVTNHAFWIGLAIIFILPLIGLMSWDLSSPSTGKATQTLSFYKAGDLLMEVTQVTSVEKLEIQFVEDVKGFTVDVESIDTLTQKFDGTVYSQFKISSSDDSKIGEIKIHLKLKEADINSLGLIKNDIKIYHNGEEITTKLTKTKNNYIYYEATIDQLGEFVIGKSSLVRKEKAAVIPPQEYEEVNEIINPEVLEPEEPVEIIPPTTEEPKPSIFSRIAAFFKNLFN